MEHIEPGNSVAVPDHEKPELGSQLSDPGPPTSDPDQMSKAEQDDHQQLHEEPEQEEGEEGEKGSNASHGEEEEEEYKGGESDGEEARISEEDDQNDGASNGNESEKVSGDEVKRKNERSNASNGNRWHLYPVRPEAEDCAFYMKTGNCRYGSHCKFNHPVRRKTQVAKEKVKETEEATEKPGQTECKYYLRTGGCKYGKACRFNHSRTQSPALPTNIPVLPALELNFLGLPIRLGEIDCVFYMRNGSCKYGSNCKFNHPDPTVAGGSDPPLAFANGGSAPIQGSSWSSPRALNEPAPFVQIMFSPTQGVPAQSPEWNGYQAPVYPSESIPPPPAYIIDNTVAQNNVFAHQQQMLVDEFPERPGQPDCSYFMRTGDCKYKSFCKYHHPKNRILKPTLCPLSDKGLPLRPDQNVCSHYSRYGICKFGPACKFHHPEQPPRSTGYSDKQTTHNDNPVIEEDARTAEKGNEKDAAVQQPL